MGHKSYGVFPGKHARKQSGTAALCHPEGLVKQTGDRKLKKKVNKIHTIKLNRDFSLKTSIQSICHWFKSYPQQNLFAESPFPGSTENSFLGLSKARRGLLEFSNLQLLDKNQKVAGS